VDVTSDCKQIELLDTCAGVCLKLQIRHRSFRLRFGERELTTRTGGMPLMRGSVMLRHDELAFIKAISTLHNKVSTAGRRNAPVVSTVRRGTTTGSGRRAELAGKRKAKEIAISGGSAEPANRRPAICAGSKPLPAKTAATGEQATASSRQPGLSGVGATYAAVFPLTHPRLCQLGRLNPQPWIRSLPNPVSLR